MDIDRRLPQKRIYLSLIVATLVSAISWVVFAPHTKPPSGFSRVLQTVRRDEMSGHDPVNPTVFPVRLASSDQTNPRGLALFVFGDKSQTLLPNGDLEQPSYSYPLSFDANDMWIAVLASDGLHVDIQQFPNKEVTTLELPMSAQQLVFSPAFLYALDVGASRAFRLDLRDRPLHSFSAITWEEAYTAILSDSTFSLRDAQLKVASGKVLDADNFSFRAGPGKDVERALTFEPVPCFGTLSVVIYHLVDHHGNEYLQTFSRTNNNTSFEESGSPVELPKSPTLISCSGDALKFAQMLPGEGHVKAWQTTLR